MKGKPTNPKESIGTDKLPLSIIPEIALAEESLAFVEGALKYGKSNYCTAGARASIYIDALLRHVSKYNGGEDRDAKTGIHHLASARACAAVILDASIRNILTDDRPPVNKALSQAIDDLSQRVLHLKKVLKK